MTFNAKQIKLNPSLSFPFPDNSKAYFNSSEIEFYLSLSGCNITPFVHMLLVDEQQWMGRSVDNDDGSFFSWWSAVWDDTASQMKTRPPQPI